MGRGRLWFILALLPCCVSSSPMEDPDAAAAICEGQLADCNEDPADGCEADLESPQSCGGCGVVCQSPLGSLPTCDSGECGFACRPGTLLCGDECTMTCQFVFESVGQDSLEIPTGCGELRVVAWGAGGADGTSNTAAAAGGFASGSFPVNAGDVVIVFVGAPGQPASAQAPGLGGAPGGGSGGSSNSEGGGGGGGFSGVFRGAVTPESAMLIAGGGGGSGGGRGNFVVPGAGGGLDGEKGLDNNGGGAGGTQTSGFAALEGGPGASRNSGDGGGGGGGGWFGGVGGAGANTDAKGGGGGSGYAAGDGTEVLLEAGSRATPGNALDPTRGTAGDPRSAGKVILDCIRG